MSRTPLFDFLQRSLAFARATLHSERPPAEVLEEARARAREVGRFQGSAFAEAAAGTAPWEKRLNRREFLSASASAAAVLAYSGCAPARIAAPSRREEAVLIVGAGIAGLTAAYRLKQSGVRARVIEAGNRAGGRVFSLRDHFADGQVAELGGELIDTNHASVRALAGELGIELDDLAADDPSLARDAWHFGGERRSEREIVEAFRPVAARIERDLATLMGDDVTYLEPNGAEKLDAMTLEEWLDRAGAKGWIGDLLDVGCFRGAEGERVRRLHFAGEHCSLEAQGFMEGGCETGEAAAREILAELGRGGKALRDTGAGKSSPEALPSRPFPLSRRRRAAA